MPAMQCWLLSRQSEEVRSVMSGGRAPSFWMERTDKNCRARRYKDVPAVEPVVSRTKRRHKTVTPDMARAEAPSVLHRAGANQRGHGAVAGLRTRQARSPRPNSVALSRQVG